MKEINVVVYTMKGCPHCEEFKKILSENSIDFYDRDIDEHQEEYGIYVSLVESDLVPALLIVETDGEENVTHLYSPGKDYEELTEALAIIKSHLK